jgi:SAM-dependent methyltransferase
MVEHIYQDGRHYDQLFQVCSGTPADLGFWMTQARELRGPVLELGCGTGRVTIPLAQAGFNVTGIDNADGMLAEARRKSSEANAEIQWIKADMRGFDLGTIYSLSILPSNTLCHLLTLDDFEACLASVRPHLAPRGRFIIDVFVPKMDLLVDKSEEKVPFAEYVDPEGRGRIVVAESYVYEPDTQIKRVTYWYAVPGEDELIPGTLNLRMYFPQELDALIKYNGFVIEDKFGSYDGTVFDSTSEKQIVICSVA